MTKALQEVRCEPAKDAQMTGPFSPPSPETASLDSLIAAVQAAECGPVELSAMPFPKAVATVHRLRLTGTLAVFFRAGRRSFLFVGGELRAVRSDCEQENLGRWLADQGLSTEPEPDDLEDSSVPLDEHTFGEAVTERVRFEHELQEWARHITHRAAGEAELGTAFCDGFDGCFPWDTLPDCNTAQLILEIARARAFTLAASELEPRHRLVVPNRGLDDLLVDFELYPSEAYLFSRLDGRRSIAELVNSSGRPAAEVEQALYALFTAGLLRFDEAPIPLARNAEAEALPVEISEAELEERALIIERARQVTTVDHYQALGLEASANQEAVHQAFERCRSTYDPARAAELHLHDQEHNLEVLLQRSKEAFDVLASPSLRQRYDMVRSSILVHAAAQVGRPQRTFDEEARRELAAANLRRAEELVAIGELHLAIVLLETAAAVDPSAAVYVRLASILGTRNTTTQRALLALQSAITLDPACEEAWLELATIWRRRGNPERQRKALDRGLATSPRSPKLLQRYRQEFGDKQLEQALDRLADMPAKRVVRHSNFGFRPRG